MAQVDKLHSVQMLVIIARNLGTDEDWLAGLASGSDREDSVVAFTNTGVANAATLVTILAFPIAA